jgi:hypothetical protein
LMFNLIFNAIPRPCKEWQVGRSLQVVKSRKTERLVLLTGP